MKANVFSIFLLSCLIVRAIFSENEISEIVPSPVLQGPLIETNWATKGALIEAIFILQNKKNSLVKNVRRVKIALLEVDHVIKDLVYERQVLFDHFYRNKAQQSGANMIDRILVDLSVFYNEILNINLIKGIYPNYLKQIHYFVHDIENSIEQFVGGNKLIAPGRLQTKIAKFDNILDIIEKEEQFLKLMVEAENLKLICKKYKDRISSRQSQLSLYGDSVKDKEDPFFIEHNDLIENSIKSLKKNMSKSINELEEKKDKIKSIKQNLNKHYGQHQLYSLTRSSNTGMPVLQLGKSSSTKPEFPLNWYVERIEEISKKLNKNFNIEGLA